MRDDISRPFLVSLVGYPPSACAGEDARTR